MAEVKNAFIKSKMNKDLDDRLIPSGEYRDAQNVQISRSESSDVGALENVLGNKEVLFSSNQVSFSTLVGAPNIKCIGQFVDENNTTIYSFWTDYFDVQAEDRIIYSSSAKNYILSYNINGSDNYKVLVEGAFLNFSQTNPIIGVNIIEGLLFWTDNRNQPRKINVNLANTATNPSNTYAVPTYYADEDSISVSKYNPYQTIEVLNVSSLAAANIVTADVNGAVNNSKTIVIDGVTGTVALGLGVSGTGVKSGTIVTKINSATSFDTNKANTIADNTALTLRGLETTMYDVTSDKLPDGTTNNPYYDANYGGDPQFLEDKFIRFSYRFKFDDGEYSVFAPFTQSMFIPKQDGYFKGDDEKLTYESTIVDFMENKVTKIDLLVPLPATRSVLQNIETSPIKITEIDILYKESDGQAIRVVDTIKVENNTPWNTNSTDDVFIYTYESTKPYKTLPESELVRVYDRVPVRAKSQELISNRVVYGNFQNKHTPPASLNYQVGISDKYADTISSSSYSTTEYPNHTVKQNRNYQVGVVLSDKFGRQSTTILSNNQATQLVNGFGADTVYSPYRTATDTVAPEWPGESLKVLFNETINSNSPAVVSKTLGTPGLYNSDKTSASYNPLGWYSYKIVVKQQEQEYYNVYLPGVMKGNPDATNTGGALSNIVLINDNINKVPRDLTEVGPQQKQFRSSVQLFGRVQNDTLAASTSGNEQFYPGRLSDTVSIIQDLRDLFDTPAATPIATTVPINGFYNAKSNPLIGQVITTQAFGVNNTSSPGPYPTLDNLAIFETEPEVSRLDIYWETSTAGLISDLNTAVATDTGGVQTTTGFTFSLNEGQASATAVAGPFYGEDIIGARIDNARIDVNPANGKWSVVNNSGTNMTSRFTLVEAGAGTGISPYEYTLKTNDTFYYGPNATVIENYTFSFTYETGGVETTPPVKTGQLQNIAPTIDGTCPRSLTITSNNLPTITTLTGKNGSADTTRDTDDLTWSIVSQTQNSSPVNVFTMTTTNNQGVLTAPSGAATYVVVVKVTDAGGLSSSNCTLNITIGQPEVNSIFNISSIAPLYDGDGVRYYFTNNYTNLDQDMGAISSNYIYGTSLVSPATQNTSNKCTNPGEIGNYQFTRKKLSGGLGVGEGAFYVQFFADAPVTTISTTSQTFNPVSLTVEYRASSASNWSMAVDVDGTTTNAKAQYNTGLTNVPVGESGFQSVSGNNNEVTLTGSVSQTSGIKRVFAFDLPGEYRITMGALNGQVCNYSNCSVTKNQSATQGFIVGDYNYGGGVSTPQQYQYNVGGTTYYAKEHITKYVSQLYTDLALTTTATLVAGTYTFFRPNVNWEYTKDGSYTANFNSSGQRTNASSLVSY
tara:strand:+ start:14441 stop:18511 length:4071 start_codon:yes stop_codon:yes gene_type:complete